MDEIKLPNPGTKEAIELGCICPVLDNNYGRGYNGDGKTFVYMIDCPLHKPFEELYFDIPHS